MTGEYPTRAGLTNWLPGVRTERFQEAPLRLQMALERDDARRGFDINIAGWSGGHPNRYFAPYNNPRLEDGSTGELLTERLATETLHLPETFKAEGRP
jgi:hypothetical protein